MFLWIATLYAVTIPLAIKSHSCSCGNNCCMSPTLEKAASGFSNLRPLFQFVDRVETVVLSPLLVISALVTATVAAVPKWPVRRTPKDEYSCFLPVIRSAVPDSVSGMFDEWELSLAPHHVQKLGDYLYRPHSTEKLVRYLLAENGHTVVEAYWLVDHFELSCFSAFEDGSFVNTHMVEQEVFDNLEIKPDTTVVSRRTIILTNVGAAELYKRHQQACLDWSTERGTQTRIVHCSNYKGVVIENEMDQIRHFHN